MSGRRQQASEHRGPRHRARKRAVQALYQWQVTGQEAGEILEQFGEEQAGSRFDDEYFETLVRRVIEHAPGLDEALAPYLERPLDQVDPVELSVLRLAAWELRSSAEVPWRVVLDEAVELSHIFGGDQGHTFVNAVLDKAARQWRASEIDA